VINIIVIYLKSVTRRWIEYKRVLVQNGYGVDVNDLNALYSLYIELIISGLS
jgi:hypothetical protein